MKKMVKEKGISNKTKSKKWKYTKSQNFYIT